MRRKISAILACVMLILVLIAFPVSGAPPYQPSNPHPIHGAIGVTLDVDPSWTGGDPDGDPVTYDVYFGTISPPPLVVSNQSGTAYVTGLFEYGTTYYWRIIAWDNNSLFNVSPIWNFTTLFNSPPYQPSNPDPANGSTGVNIDIDPSWTGGDPEDDPVYFDVYLGTTSPPPVVASNHINTYYDPGILGVDTTYYWRITAWDIYNQFNTSPIWNFTTRPNTAPYPASNPGPINNSIDINTDTDLSWNGGDPDPFDSVTYNLFFDTDPDPSLVEMSITATTYDIPGRLSYGTQYYWKINTLDSYGGVTEGPIWNFLTKDDIPPDTPHNPSPANQSINVSIFADLSWSGGDPDPGDIVTYDVYFGNTNPPPMVVNNQSANTYDPGTLTPGITYYWMITAWDDFGYSATGYTWTFSTTENNPPNTPSNPSPTNNSIDVSIDDVVLSWTGGDPNPYDTVTYNVFFGSDPNPPLVSPDQTTTTYDPGELNYFTQYYWRIEAQDNFGLSTNSPTWTFATGIYENDPPVRPNPPDGPPSGRHLQSHTYTATTTDPDGDQVYYRFDWDDGQISNWLGPYESGRTVSASHMWLLQGTYGIKVQARDSRYAMSEWSDPFPVYMPKNKQLLHHPLFLFIFKFLEQHPHLFPILRLRLGL